MLYGKAQIDGRGRPSEDRICILNLMDQCDLFAVFDGHSGSGAARLSVDLLGKRLQSALTLSILADRTAFKALLEKVFIDHDKELATKVGLPEKDPGSTATVALITPTYIAVAYLGDSPCFLMNPTTGLIMHEIGKHEPTLLEENRRIVAAGGTVEVDEYGIPRVDGALMVSRAFGDFSLKFDIESGPVPMSADWTKMKVTAHPDVVFWDRPEAGVLAIMSDGMVETETTALKPLAQVSRDVQLALQGNRYDLTMSAEKLVKQHVVASVGQGKAPYDGDDLSIILVDVGRISSAQAGGAVQQRPQSAPPVLSSKPRTRKVRFGRRNKTGKKNRLIKIFSC